MPGTWPRVTLPQYKPPDHLSEVFRQGLVEGDKQVESCLAVSGPPAAPGDLPSAGVAATTSPTTGETRLSGKVPRQGDQADGHQGYFKAKSPICTLRHP